MSQTQLCVKLDASFVTYLADTRIFTEDSGQEHVDTKGLGLSQWDFSYTNQITAPPTFSFEDLAIFSSEK